MTVLTHTPEGIHDRKDIAGGEVKVLDADQGVVEAIVSVTNVRDDVDDIILPGAYAETLDARKPKGVWCADETTELLTDKGWKRYDEIPVGALAYTLDTENLTAQFEPVLAVNVFPAEQRQMRHVEVGGFSSLTTLNHRWPVRNVQGKTLWKTTSELGVGHGIFRSLPNRDTPEEPKWSDAFVQIVAWAWNDGHFDESGETARLSIFQSKTKDPLKCAAIRSALSKAFPGQWCEQAAGNNKSWEFSLGKEATEAVAAVCGPDKAPTPEFLLSLTYGQLLLFIAAGIDGDSHAEVSGVTRWTQRSEHSLRMFEMACALAGIPTNTRPKPSNETRDAQQVTLLKRHVARPLSAVWMATRYRQKANPGTPQRTVAIDEIVTHDGIVWCPTTPSGTWLARRNGSVYFTGNSHDWGIPVAKTLDSVELMPGDPELPPKIQALGGGGLKITMQFNLATQRGRDAFEDVKFFGEDSEWSIGYVVPAGASTIDQKSGVRKIKRIELFEYSPVLFGANAHTATMSVKKAIGSHKTDTSDAPWDGPKNEAKLSSDDGASVLRKAYAWVDPDKDPSTKSAYKFIHHLVSSDGSVGAASTKACSTGIGVLNGGRGGTVIPDADKNGVYAHLAKHLRDAGMEPPDLKAWMDQIEAELKDADADAGGAATDANPDPDGDGDDDRMTADHIFVGFMANPGICSTCGNQRGHRLHRRRHQGLSAEPAIEEAKELEEKPYEIRKEGDQYCVVNQTTGEKVPGGCHDSRADAVDHMRALYANVPDADKAMDNEEYGPHDYEPSVEGNDNSPCEICGLPQDASIHDISGKSMHTFEPVQDNLKECVHCGQSEDYADHLKDEPKSLPDANEEIKAPADAKADDEEDAADNGDDEEAEGEPVKLPADVAKAFQDIDRIADSVLRIYKIPDIEPNDNSDEVPAAKAMEWDAVEGATGYRLTFHKGFPYVEAFEGESKKDPFFPHVYESGGNEGTCRLCGLTSDANIHIPMEVVSGDPLNPKLPGPATLPNNPTKDGPLDPKFPGEARDPANPTAGGPLDPALPGAATDPANPTVDGPLDPKLPGPATLPNSPTVGGPLNPALPGAARDPSNPTSGGPLDPALPNPGAAKEPYTGPKEGEPADIEAKVDVSLAGSLEDIRNQAEAQLANSLPTPTNDGASQEAWVEATFPDSVLVAVVEFAQAEADDEDPFASLMGLQVLGFRYFSYPYTSTDGAVSLGQPKEVSIAGVISPKGMVSEEYAEKTLNLISEKAGRTLSGANADKIKAAVEALISVLGAAGIEIAVSEAETSEAEKVAIPEHLLMQNDLLRLLAQTDT